MKNSSLKQAISQRPIVETANQIIRSSNDQGVRLTRHQLNQDAFFLQASWLNLFRIPLIKSARFVASPSGFQELAIENKYTRFGDGAINSVLGESAFSNNMLNTPDFLSFYKMLEALNAYPKEDFDVLNLVIANNLYKVSQGQVLTNNQINGYFIDHPSFRLWLGTNKK